MGCAEILASLHFNQAKSAVLVELVGTFFLVLTASLATHEDSEVAPLAVGFMLMALIFAFGYISGGHFNPAVTLAALLCHRSSDMPEFKWYTAVLYAVAQLLGAGGAGLYMLAVVGFDFPVPNTANEPAAVFQGFFAESVFTFVLASVVMHVALSSQRQNDFYGFAIGMAVMSAALCVGGISGGAFNPAVATGLIVIKCFAGLRCEAMIHLWMYWAAELVGALVAVVLFNSVTAALGDAGVKAEPTTDSNAGAAAAAAREGSTDLSEKQKDESTKSVAAANATGDTDEREMTPAKPTAPATAAPPKSPVGPKIRPMPTTGESATKPQGKTPHTGGASPPSGRATPSKPSSAPPSPAPDKPQTLSASSSKQEPKTPEKKDPKDDVSPLDVDEDDDATR